MQRASFITNIAPGTYGTQRFPFRLDPGVYRFVVFAMGSATGGTGDTTDGQVLMRVADTNLTSGVWPYVSSTLPADGVTKSLSGKNESGVIDLPLFSDYVEFAWNGGDLTTPYNGTISLAVDVFYDKLR